MNRQLRNYILRRLGQMPVVLIFVSIVVFYVIHLPQGGPLQLLAGRASEAQLEAFRNQYNLNEPLYVQYVLWVKGLLSGNLGQSLATSQSVGKMLVSHLPVTFVLAICSSLFALVIALPAGYISAVEQYNWKDNVATVAAFIGLSIPNFFLAILLIRFFAVDLGWLPVAADSRLFTEFGYTVKVFVLPIVSLGTALAAQTTRILRSSMLDIFSMEYVEVSRAKGLSEKVVNRGIVFKNALIPVITVVALQMGYVLGGTVVTEFVFSLPGLGTLMVQAVNRRDYPVMQTVVLLYALAFMLLNLSADVLYGYIDPRIRYGGEEP